MLLYVVSSLNKWINGKAMNLKNKLKRTVWSYDGAGTQMAGFCFVVCFFCIAMLLQDGTFLSYALYLNRCDVTG